MSSYLFETPFMWKFPVKESKFACKIPWESLKHIFQWSLFTSYHHNIGFTVYLQLIALVQVNLCIHFHFQTHVLRLTLIGIFIHIKPHNSEAIFPFLSIFLKLITGTIKPCLHQPRIIENQQLYVNCSFSFSLRLCLSILIFQQKP